MTDSERLAELDRLERTATDGPWSACDASSVPAGGPRPALLISSGEDEGYVEADFVSLKDAEVCAAFRNSASWLLDKIAALQQFKDYVHNRLDEAGVPHDPNPEHTKETGCRIGGRLDTLIHTVEMQDEVIAARDREIERLKKLTDDRPCAVCGRRSTDMLTQDECFGCRYDEIAP